MGFFARLGGAISRVVEVVREVFAPSPPPPVERVELSRGEELLTVEPREGQGSARVEPASARVEPASARVELAEDPATERAELARFVVEERPSSARESFSPVVIALPPPTKAQRERWAVETLTEAESRWAQAQKVYEVEAVKEEDLARALGADVAGLGHPLLLGPLELLERWTGLSEAEALAYIEEVSREEGVDAAALLKDQRDEALEKWSAELQRELGRASAQGLGMAPPSSGTPITGGAKLQGSAMSASGDLFTALASVWDRWVRSTLSRVPGELAPLLLIKGAEENPSIGAVRTALGVEVRVPDVVWRAGVSAIMDWLVKMNVITDDADYGAQVILDDWAADESDEGKA